MFVKSFLNIFQKKEGSILITFKDPPEAMKMTDLSVIGLREDQLYISLWSICGLLSQEMKAYVSPSSFLE